jgi:hypothetical protein
MALEKWTQQDDAMPWFADHSNMVLLASWLAEHNYSGQDVAYAMEKPWKYESEYLTARKEVESTDDSMERARAVATDGFESLVMIEGRALDELQHLLELYGSRTIPPYRMRIAVDEGQLKIKVNEEVWSVPLGPVITGDGAR